MGKKQECLHKMNQAKNYEAPRHRVWRSELLEYPQRKKLFFIIVGSAQYGVSETNSLRQCCWFFFLSPPKYGNNINFYEIEIFSKTGIFYCNLTLEIITK